MQQTTPKKIFVCEFITCGGLHHNPIPEGLKKEGKLMRDALFRDISEMPEWQIITTHDERIEPSPYAIESISVQKEHNINALWKDCMAKADAVWLIAPETDETLLKLSELALSMQCNVIGSGLDSVRITSNKLHTAAYLKKCRIHTIETYTYQNWSPSASEVLWVLKPIDGAGCEQTFILDEVQVDTYLNDRGLEQEKFIIQPYIEGIPASLSILATSQGHHLLSANLQHISLQNHVLNYRGGVLNGMDPQYLPAVERLMDNLYQHFSDLKGYYGVDILLNPEDVNVVTVVEINPRLTTTYVALRDAMEVNPAKIILESFEERSFSMPKIARNIKVMQLE